MSKRGGGTHPVATDGDVENDIEGLVRQRRPDTRVVDRRAQDLVVLLAVHEPGDLLLLPVGRPAVDLDAPHMVLVVCERRRLDKSLRLLAGAAGVHVAVGNTVRLGLPVDVLEEIELAAGRPLGRALAEAVAVEPEGVPHALLVGGWVVGDAELGLDARHLAVLGREGRQALDAARRPAPRGRAVLARDDLQRLGAREAEVVLVPAVALQLVVVVLVALGDVPHVLVRERVGGALEGRGPGALVARVGRGISGVGRGQEQRDGREDLPGIHLGRREGRKGERFGSV